LTHHTCMLVVGVKIKIGVLNAGSNETIYLSVKHPVPY